MDDVCFQLKGSVVSVLVLEFQHFSESNFVRQLKQKIAQAPRLLHQSPVVLSLEKLDETAANIDFSLVADHCRALGLQPVGIKGEGEQVAEAARRSGLALLPRTAAETSERKAAPSLADGSDYKKSDHESRAPEARPSKLVTQPVRSGQQVYAQGADLVVVSQVSEGAEVLADGHIHVYGPLRGRALAGIQGDESARIFCRSLEAELLSVAGQFLLSDGVPEALWKQPAQVYFDGTTLVVQPL